MSRALFGAVSLAALVLTFASGPALAGPDDPVVDHSSTTSALEALPRLPISQRKVVGVYEFSSGVPGVSNTALTDMFTTALVKSGAFLVGERQHLATDITSEKALNAEGKSTGDTANQKIVALQFIFEGAVTESNANQDSHSASLSVGGMSVDKSHQTGKIAIDVRVVDADTGLVMDAVDVSKLIHSRSSGVSGVGNLANSIAGLHGHSIPLSPDVSSQKTHNDGVDEAVRACIEAAVLVLVHRYATQQPAQ
ncbi:MAG: CsgG/HfaB family protein [Caulobacterales bacterium]